MVVYILALTGRGYLLKDSAKKSMTKIQGSDHFDLNWKSENVDQAVSRLDSFYKQYLEIDKNWTLMTKYRRARKTMGSIHLPFYLFWLSETAKTTGSQKTSKKSLIQVVRQIFPHFLINRHSTSLNPLLGSFIAICKDG